MLAKKTALLVLLFVLSTGDWGCGDKTFAKEKGKKKAAENIVLSTDELASNPMPYVGKNIKFYGPVGNVFAKEKRFTVVCGCGVHIPVQYGKALPKSGENVMVVGKLVKTAQKQLVVKAVKWEKRL